jgi:type III restriction enzyme
MATAPGQPMPGGDTYWVPGVNHTAQYGRWAFVEFTEVYQIEADFKAKVESEFSKMIEGIVKGAA